MKSFVRNALLGAAGLVIVALPAQAASSTSVIDTPLFKPTAVTEPIQLAQRSENPGGGMFRNENPGGGMYNKGKKAKKKKARK